MHEVISRDIHTGIATGLAEVIEQKRASERFEVQAERWHETCELFAGAANHEAKIVTALVLAAEPDRFFAKGSLTNAVTERQGINPGWKQNRGAAFSYCRDSLEPIGQVVHGIAYGSGSLKNTLVQAYRFNADAPPEDLAAIGLVADWSLKWKDLSAQTALGSTASRGDSRASEARMDVLLELATSPSLTMATSEIAGLSNIVPKTRTSCIDQLEEQKLVVVETVEDNNDREFVIENNQYTGRRPLENLRLETRLVYKFLGQKEVGDKFTKEDLLDYVARRVIQLEPDYDLAVVRDQLTMKLARDNLELPGIQRLQNYNGDTGTRTRVSLASEYAEALKELVGIVVGINDRDPALIAHGRKRAKEIISNPQNVHDLMAKALRFSSGAQSAGAEATTEAIISLVARADTPLDAVAVQEGLKRRGIKLGVQTVRRYLQELGESGELQPSRIRKDPTAMRTVLAYAIAKPEPHEDN